MLRPKNDLLFVIILTLLLVVPFINKAFHIDDTAIIYAAKGATTINWYGLPQNIRALSDSPFISHYIALIIKATGESEFWLHSFFLIFLVIATISMYFLSKRFTTQPLISTLFLVSAPVFIVSSTNIMPDFALFTFYMAAICIFIYGIEYYVGFFLAT